MIFRPKGVIVALVTPITRDDEVDVSKLRSLVRHVTDAGVHALAPGVATSEYVSLSMQERKKVISIVRDEAKGSIPVMSGVVSPGIKDALEIIRYAKDAGVDGVMVVSPYYNVAASQEGIYEYYKLIAEKSDIPIMLYNIPYKTGVNISPETSSRLASVENIVGIKECNRDFSHFNKLVQLAGTKMSICAGEDDLFLLQLMVGAKGVVSATANLIPRLMVEIFESYQKGELAAAIQVHQKILPLLSFLFSEPNPSPLKEALAMVGLPCGTVRLPLLPPTKSTLEALSRELSILGVRAGK